MPSVREIEWMAVGWGGMVAGVALIVVSTGDGVWRVATMAVLCLVAGFLAGVRAPDRRILHAAVAALAGVAFYVAFSAITRLIDLFGGPDGARWLPGGDGSRVAKVALALAAVVIGGIGAAYRLRPQPGHRRPRG